MSKVQRKLPHHHMGGQAHRAQDGQHEHDGLEYASTAGKMLQQLNKGSYSKLKQSQSPTINLPDGDLLMDSRLANRPRENSTKMWVHCMVADAAGKHVSS